jgi:hypothetical protein
MALCCLRRGTANSTRPYNGQTVDVRLVGARPNIHQAGERTNHEVVVDEDVRLNSKRLIAAFDVAVSAGPRRFQRLQSRASICGRYHGGSSLSTCPNEKSSNLIGRRSPGSGSPTRIDLVSRTDLRPLAPNSEQFPSGP